MTGLCTGSVPVRVPPGVPPPDPRLYWVTWHFGTAVRLLEEVTHACVRAYETTCLQTVPAYRFSL